MPKKTKSFGRKKSLIQSVRLGKRPTASQRGYDNSWQNNRKEFLKLNPLCVFCKKKGVNKSANTVDHIIPHKGDMKLFRDKKNWQSLCSRCHNSTKKRIENRGGVKVYRVSVCDRPIRKTFTSAKLENG